MSSRNFRQFMIACILLGFMATMLIISKVVTAQSFSLPNTPDERALLPYLLPADGTQFIENSILTPDTPPSWSKGVFQSYRNGNWEIYRPGTRLTVNSSSDIQPRFNRGADRIIFSSNRDGDYEIYIMNGDGSGLEQLTNNLAHDVNPAWSPDGQQIAFQSYRDGQAEVYVMSVNGSNQHRLTVHGSYDGEPAWSPDGNKVAFTSARTGIPFIYVMNNDGSGITKLSSQPSYYPAWSPDGSRIAYSGDQEGDDWLELWLMNTDGSNQHMIFDPYRTQADAWVRGWTPDGHAITYTNIEFIKYQGNWYWERASINEYDVETENIHNLDNNSLNWHPDWQTTDAAPPQTKMEPLPTFSQLPDFYVRWSGSDPGSEAGLATYDVQYRVGPSGSWINWQMGVTETAAIYTGVPNTTVIFRSRARDHAYNWEEWSVFDNPSTTFYTWQLWGQLTDNRGAPLSHVPLAVAPAPLSEARTDNEGNFLVRLKTEGSHTLDVNRSGYGDLAQTSLNLQNLAHVYLPPGNNVLLNGGFEAAQPLMNWTTGGSLPVTAVIDPSHTGTKSGLLGNNNCTYPCLSNSESLDGSYGYDDIAVDSQGVVHMVGTNGSNVTYISRTPLGWGSSEQLSTSYGSKPRLALDTTDGLHAFWITNNKVYNRYKPANGSWGAPIVTGVLPDPPSGYYYRIDQSITDSQNNPHILIESFSNYSSVKDIYHMYRLSAGSWSSPTLFAEYPSRYENGKMVLGFDGVLHFFWSENYSNIFPSPSRLMHRPRFADGSWGTKEELPIAVSNLEGVAIAADGTIHITWWRRTGYYCPCVVYHAFRASDGDWSIPTVILSTNDYSYEGTRSDISVDSQGQVHALLRDYDAESVVYRQWRPGSGWQAAVSLPNDDIFQSLKTAVDQYDIVHLLTPGTLWANDYYRSLPATSSGTASLSQVVTIPANVPAPTLAFMLQRPGDVYSDTSGFELLVSAGVTTTAVPITTGGAAWSHAWADMSPWSGQTVTVTFKLTQTSGDPRVQLVLDDVTLGSAYPDSWVRGSGQAVALPGEQVVLQIAYGNQGSIPAENGMLTAVLPDELTFVSASIMPTITNQTLIWDIGDLTAVSIPDTLMITATISSEAPLMQTIALPITLNTETTEIEQLNNTAMIELFIAYRLHLPIIFKP